MNAHMAHTLFALTDGFLAEGVIACDAGLVALLPQQEVGHMPEQRKLLQKPERTSTSRKASRLKKAVLVGEKQSLAHGEQQTVDRNRGVPGATPLEVGSAKKASCCSSWLSRLLPSSTAAAGAATAAGAVTATAPPLPALILIRPSSSCSMEMSL